MAYKAGIVGASGFAGAELVRLLLRHPDFELATIVSDSLAHLPLAQAYPAFSGICDLCFSARSEACFDSCDIVFLAVPHTAAQKMAPAMLEKGLTVVDLSADFRLKDAAVYEKWYKTKHTARDLLAASAFGLPEITRSELDRVARAHAEGEAVLVACAGCYPTASSLAAYPAIQAGLFDAKGTVVIDAISGVTGAGKAADERTHYCFANENVEAYGVAVHRHTPEIRQILGLDGRQLVFTPHLAPLNRGLLATVTLPLAESSCVPSADEIAGIYADFYRSSPLVTVLPADTLPKTASVAGTSRAHIGVAVCEDAHMLVAIAAIDNLGKGAAGQAIQCANIVFGLAEDRGLDCVSPPV